MGIMKNFEPEAIGNKLAGMIKRVQLLRRYETLTLDEYLQNEDIQAGVERLLEQVIQSALDINRAFLKRVVRIEAQADGKPIENAATFILAAEYGLISSELGESLAKSGGFRNVLAHLYDEILPERVYTALSLSLDHYPHYALAIQTYLDSLETEDDEES
jgi:uncharacterized protein YutE (UPF0331/DUF86 family)